MSPEDFGEMVGQIPALEEMLEARRRRLSELEITLNADREAIAALREEIEELELEIAGRKEALEP